MGGRQAKWWGIALLVARGGKSSGRLSPLRVQVGGCNQGAVNEQSGDGWLRELPWVVRR